MDGCAGADWEGEFDEVGTFPVQRVSLAVLPAKVQYIVSNCGERRRRRRKFFGQVAGFDVPERIHCPQCTQRNPPR